MRKNFSFLLTLCFIALSAISAAGYASSGYPPNRLMRYVSGPASLPKAFQNFKPGSLAAVEFDVPGLKASLPLQTFTFDLPKVGAWNVVFDRRISHRNGTETWFGHSEAAGQRYDAALTLSGTLVTGRIATPHRTLSVRTVGRRTWLIDTVATGVPPGNHADPIVPDAQLDQKMLAAMDKLSKPAIQLTVPDYFRVKQTQEIRWLAPDFDPSLTARIYFTKNRTDESPRYVRIKKVRMGKGVVKWKPKDARVTDYGAIRICARPKKIAAIVCTQSDAMVIARLAPSLTTGVKFTGMAYNWVRLGWTPATDDDAVVGYRITRNGVPIYTGAAVDGYLDKQNLTEKTSYIYQVRAYDANFQFGPLSQPLTITTPSMPVAPDTTPPTVPAQVAASATSSAAVTIVWDASTDTGGSGLSGYEVIRDGLKITEVGETQYQDAGLVPGTLYRYQVRAVDAAGNRSEASSEVSVTTLQEVDSSPPSIPSNVAAAAISQESIGVSWQASSDEGGSGVAGYRIRRDGVAIAPDLLAETSFVDTGLSPSTTHRYTVEAIDGAGLLSGESASVEATTLAGTVPTSTVDVLAYYNDDLAEGEARVQYLLDLQNFALANSGVQMKMRLVRAIPVSVPSHHTNADMLYELGGFSQGTGSFANVATDRVSAGADLVTFVRAYDSLQGSCGVAFLNGAAGGVLSSGYAFSVVSDGSGCLETALAHETGHNLGLAHDRANSSSSGVLPYSYGFCVPDVAGDVMSYCAYSTVPYYSSPHIVVNETVLGVAIGDPNEADNVSSLNETRTTSEHFTSTTQ